MSDNNKEILVEEFPSNSHKSKKVVEERKLEKVVTGKVVTRKKTLGKRFQESFLGEESRNVGEYIIYDILIPAAKDMIVDTIKGGIEMMMYGEKRGRNITRDRGRSYHTSYGSYYRQNDREQNNRDHRRDISRTGRARHDFSQILLESRGEAEEVLENLCDQCATYNLATVADLYDLVGITSNFTDNKYGWTDLRDASVSRVRGGYELNLPRPQPVD